MRQASSRTSNDAQVREFERRDLGRNIASSGSAAVVRPKSRRMPTSILLDPAIIKKLRVKGQRRGIGYQTMLKIIVSEHVDEY